MHIVANAATSGRRQSGWPVVLTGQDDCRAPAFGRRADDPNFHATISGPLPHRQGDSIQRRRRHANVSVRSLLPQLGAMGFQREGTQWFHPLRIRSMPNVELKVGKNLRVRGERSSISVHSIQFFDGAPSIRIAAFYVPFVGLRLGGNFPGLLLQISVEDIARVSTVSIDYNDPSAEFLSGNYSCYFQ